MTRSGVFELKLHDKEHHKTHQKKKTTQENIHDTTR